MNQPNDSAHDHDDESDFDTHEARQTPGFAPNEAKVSFLDRLRDSLASKRTVLAHAQARAEADEQRLIGLTNDYKRLDGERQYIQGDLDKLDATYQRLTSERPAMLARCRAAWLVGNFSSTLGEIDVILADYPAHRAILVEQLAAAESAIKAFRRKHQV